MSVAPAFAVARAEQRAALVAYWPLGFPDVATSAAALETIAAAGADVIEIGLPYSDPVMDGPTIQQASTIALAGGVRTAEVFNVLPKVTSAVPTLVMTYWNLVERFGVDEFATALAEAGGSGLITPDLIPEEAGAWLAARQRHELDSVFLVAPSSTPARIAATTAVCRGFVYATAVMGVTGARDAVSTAAPQLVAAVRKASMLPVAVGLGVSNRAQAAVVAEYADGVIVGSALVRCLLDADSTSAGLAALDALVRDLAAGVRGG